ncbi:MAG TPA: phosphoglycerate mutase, partial [Nitrospiria bacterium]|nr:phosphoglycerate mutase [Nitrospiria bacterium]
VEAPDEASHIGDLAAKIKSLEDFDQLTIGTLLKGMDKFGEYRILLLPDHYNPVALKTHTSEPVPYAFYEKSKTSKIKKSGKGYNEAAAQSTGIYYEEGIQLIDHFMKG